jgi:hypothetical protein
MDRTDHAPIAIGSDRVSLDGGRVVVESPADMPGWEVRAYRRVAILWRGGRYFVADKTHAGARVRYTLEPWDEARADIDAGVIEYDESYVATRDEARRARAAASGVRTVLVPFYPLIGLLPGAVKRRLADGYGIEEERATIQSLWLESCVALMIGAMLSISSVAGVYGHAFGVDSVPWLHDVGRAGPIALALLVPDVVMRYAKILGESSHSWGFWEWLFRREPS